jgi:DNA-binding LacI/PurR family transcriptional regulator
LARLDRTSPVPLYHQIERELRGLIQERKLARGALFPSENELALQYEVTRLTVRRAIDRLVQQGVLYRERGRGTYIADPGVVGEPVAPGTMKLQLPSMASIIHLETLEGAEREARAHGYQLVVSHSNLDPAVEASRIRSALAAGMDGLLLWPLGGPTDRSQLERLRVAGLPFVLIDRYIEDMDSDYVGVDDFAGAYQATSHLAELGHRRIALLLYEGVEVSAVRLRRDGYRQALQDHGLVYDEGLIAQHYPTLPEPGNLELMTSISRRLLQLPAPPTAAFCINDHLAQGLLIALQRQGIEVPQAFSIAGFDGLEYMPTHQRLTTVRRATTEMGREAVRLILARRAGEDGPPKHIVLPTELVVGETSGPLPGAQAPAT